MPASTSSPTVSFIMYAHLNATLADMFRVNEYVRQLSGGGGKAKNANEALDGFTVSAQHCGLDHGCVGG
eukprot:1160630-Pelagomonas_calceolata.AAC.4